MNPAPPVTTTLILRCDIAIESIVSLPPKLRYPPVEEALSRPTSGADRTLEG